MTDLSLPNAELRSVRDQLLAQLEILDAQGESLVAIEVNSAIEILNERLGDAVSDASIAQLQQDYFGD